jgi:uncharacterized delta-60 repeat protein
MIISIHAKLQILCEAVTNDPAKKDKIAGRSDSATLLRRGGIYQINVKGADKGVLPHTGKKLKKEVMKINLKKFTGNFLSTRLSLVVCAALVSASTFTGAQAGQLDKGFASAGIFSFKLSTRNGNNNVANAVALQSDGKIVVAGQLGSRSGLIRLNPNGSVDSTFGNDGVVVTKLGGVIDQFFGGVAIQSDGKIVVVASGVPPREAVARFNSDGSLDNAFGSAGVASLPLAGSILALQPDGKIVVAGQGPGVTTTFLARLNSNGQLDSTFGSGGLAPMQTFGSNAIALQADGKIVVASGAAFGVTGSLARYNKDGSVDKTFGISGQAASIAAPAAIAVQSDGKILAAGADTSKVSANGNSTGFGLVRFNSDGTIDTTFGTHGGAITGFPKTSATGAFAVTLQPNGDIVAAGQAGNNVTMTVESFALARYASGGQLDSTFGTGGRVTTSFGNNANAFITSLVLQSDGKIVVAGTNGVAGSNAGTSLEVARYLGQ